MLHLELQWVVIVLVHFIVTLPTINHDKSNILMFEAKIVGPYLVQKLKWHIILK